MGIVILKSYWLLNFVVVRRFVGENKNDNS